jgi:hypothetical protein
MKTTTSGQIKRGVVSAAVILIIVFASGCAGGRFAQSTGEYLDSKALNAKVKTALWDDPVVNGFDIDVDVWKSVVQLNGFVDTLEQKRRAETIAWGISGVDAVDNNLVVKSRMAESGVPADPISGTELRESVDSASGAADSTPQTGRAQGVAGPLDPARQFARVYADPTQYYGGDVTLEGQVESIFSKNGFLLKSPDGLSRTMLVVGDKDAIASLSPGGMVKVEGTARAFDLLKIEEELGERLDTRDFHEYRGKPAILATSIEEVRRER